MRASRRHGDAVDRQPSRYRRAAPDEDSARRGRRGSGGDRLLRDGADDPAAAVGAACAGLVCDRRFRQAGLCRDRAHPGTDALQAPAGFAAVLRGGEGVGRQDRDRACRSAPAERRASRHQALQHHVPRKRRGGADRLRPVASQPSARPAAGGVPRALRHRALYGAGATAGRARRSAQRPVFARRAALFLHHRRAAVRRDRDAARHAAQAVARSASAALAQGRLSALATGDRAALSGDRSGAALSDRLATRLRPRPSRPGQAHRARRTAEARSALRGLAPPLQPGHGDTEAEIRHCPRNSPRARSSRWRSIPPKARTR